MAETSVQAIRTVLDRNTQGSLNWSLAFQLLPLRRTLHGTSIEVEADMQTEASAERNPGQAGHPVGKTLQLLSHQPCKTALTGLVFSGWTRNFNCSAIFTCVHLYKQALQPRA